MPTLHQPLQWPGRFARRARLAMLFVGASAAISVASAESLPLWEAGAGLASVSLPDYRGSDQRRNYVLPMPYLVYRGERLKADRDGMRGVLFDHPDLELSLSAGASPPVRSDNNTARQGMPDLRPVLELGPSLEATLWRSADATLKLRAPIRSAFTLAASPKTVGWVFSPRLNLDFLHFADTPWEVGMLAGPIYASRRHHAYFYSVAPAFSTATRPAYDAPGGYAGTQFLISVSRRFEHTWLGAFVRWDSLSGAVFNGSSLVRESDYLAAGLAVAWVFGESSRRVDSLPWGQ